MKAWKHAERSAGEMGGEFASHLAAHGFLDRTKDAWAQVGHRYLLHSEDFGTLALTLAQPSFPDAQRLVSIHLRDDLGRSATMSDWLCEMRPTLLPRVRGGPFAGMSTVETAEMLSRRFGLSDITLTHSVCKFMASADALAPDAPEEVRRVALRNSFGIGLAEACLGMVHDLPGGRRIGVREVAEAEVMGNCGCILPYSAVAKSVGLRPWMVGG
jgi:hypothetical protein